MTQDMPAMSPGPRPRRRRRAILLFQAILVAGLGIGIWLGLRSNVEVSPLAAPSHLGEMRLAGQVTGQQAVLQAQRLHGKDVGIIDGYVAEYRGDGERMTLWVGQAESDLATQELVERMTEAMGGGSSSFTDPQEIVVDGKAVFTTSGGGGMNYYYRVTDRVVWVTLNSPQPQEGLRAVLRAIQ